MGSIWVLFGGAVFLGETITLTKLIGIFLIIAANVLVIWQGQKIIFSKGIKFIILGTFLFSFGSLVDKSITNNFSPSLYKAVLLIFEVIFLFIFFLKDRIRSIKNEFKLQGLKIIFIGPLLSLALYFLMKAFQEGGEASRVLPIWSLSLIFSTILGIFLLNEKSNLVKKFTALVLVSIGVYLLQVFK